MATHDLTADVLRAQFTYNPETGHFIRRGESNPSGRIATKGYRQIALCGRRYMAHRLAWLYVHSEWPDGQLDHKNQIKDDNRIDNLREATNKQNGENIQRFSHNTSGHRGVRQHPRTGKWIAEIKHHKRSMHIGSFDTMSEAVQARVSAEQMLFTHAPVTHFFTHMPANPISMRGSTRAPGTRSDPSSEWKSLF